MFTYSRLYYIATPIRKYQVFSGAGNHTCLLTRRSWLSHFLFLLIIEFRAIR